QPGHVHLGDAVFLERARTAPAYRLYLVDDLWPALAPADDGVSIACELYECTEERLALLAELEPPGWSRAPLALEDGSEAEAFLGDRALAARPGSCRRAARRRDRPSRRRRTRAPRPAQRAGTPRPARRRAGRRRDRAPARRPAACPHDASRHACASVRTREPSPRAAATLTPARRRIRLVA